ncbi:Alkaline phosphatase PafA [Arenibacter antarcticus]|uniref:Alkaline phosphatase PafA n=1 Tax=Arenibacter antarcticus TaxID=2040469 RepID=A0ABW5VDG7_9FLAO|nr:alkaline phosphatase PafA [Arenibacter sp. H213]MCM4168467.1 alkaline phosphatase [Arenibacter sp. H213]
MIKRSVLVLFLLVFLGYASVPLHAQRKSRNKIEISETKEIAATPKLVVGIVVDQMRYDYLTRFWDRYGEGGFKRMVNDGFNCKNNHFNYAPTYTGPGHASVYTGTSPSVHGIIGNDWYDKFDDKSVYCAGDDSYNSVGTASDSGKMSPHRMQSTTMTDQLRLHTQMQGKVIAVAIKDRGAVLPGGHSANAAYWFKGGDEGNWITSTYYMDELPTWVKDFNTKRSVDAYKKPWTTLKDINTYAESGSDKNNYEGLFKGKASATFPYDLEALWDDNDQYSILANTPYGNSLTTDFALAALDKESLGEDNITDFLAVSYSSTDYVGHKWGVNSKEIQDTYMRLDQDLERLFKRLDEKVGVGEYTVFLTADHAAVHVPAYLKDQKIPANYLSLTDIKNKLNDYLKYTFGSTEIIKNISNNQIFLDHKVVNNLDIDLAEIQNNIAQELILYEGIYKIYTANQMWQNNYTKGISNIIQNGYNQKRSGDILIVYDPSAISYNKTGSTHGSPWIYDTHSPLLFFGKGIKKGSTVNRTEIPDIAPTISALLGMAFPSGTTGAPIVEVLE